MHLRVIFYFFEQSDLVCKFDFIESNLIYTARSTRPSLIQNSRNSNKLSSRFEDHPKIQGKIQEQTKQWPRVTHWHLCRKGDTQKHNVAGTFGKTQGQKHSGTRTHSVVPFLGPWVEYYCTPEIYLISSYLKDKIRYISGVQYFLIRYRCAQLDNMPIYAYHCTGAT